MTSGVTDNRKDYDAFLERMKKLKNKPHTAVGILGEGSGDGDFGLVEQATANEFGTIDNGGHTPERSFIRSTMDENENRLVEAINKKKMEILLGKTSIKKALDFMGVMITGLIKKKITDIDSPPNADGTIKKKGSSNPLIDTGRMRSSIQHKVET